MRSIQYDDPKVWDLLCSGKTKGIFQMESPLVQKWVRKIQPKNIWELSTVIAIVRPGPLVSGLADDYVHNKNNSETFLSFGHPLVDEILKDTHYITCFQEQIMLLSARLAWPDLEFIERSSKVDKLRKSIGKKDQAKLVVVGNEFVTGCAKNGIITKELAERLFEIIKNCGRYLFNLSHSMCYAYAAYEMAWQKTYHPAEFFTTALSFSPEKIDPHQEVQELMQDMHHFGMKLLPPNINAGNIEFRIESPEAIRFGLSHVKFFGETYRPLVKNLPPIKHWQQMVLLGFTKSFGFELRSNTLDCLIKSGAFSDTGLTPSQLLAIAKLFDKMTVKEIGMVVPHFDGTHAGGDIEDLFERHVYQETISSRVPKIRDLCKLFRDEFNAETHPGMIENYELESLGIVLTASSLDASGIVARHNCVDCTEDMPKDTARQILAKIRHVKFKKTKKGDPMATLDVADNSGVLNHVAVFSEILAQHELHLRENNIILLDICKGNYGGWFTKQLTPIVV